MATGAAPAATATDAAPAAAAMGTGPVGTVNPAAGSVAGSAAAFVGQQPVDAGVLGVEQLVARALAWERTQRAVSAAQLVDIAAFDTLQHATDQDNKIGSRLSGRTVNPEVAINLGISTTAAACRVAFARCVVDDHSALLRCLADGLISEWHLRMVVGACQRSCVRA